MKINKIDNIKVINNSEDNNFKGSGNTLFKVADLFIKSQENLSSTRFIQDTATNWLPKAVFTRSKADFAEMSFLEFIESGIFYFASPILGEKLFRNKLFTKALPKNIKETVNKNIPESLNSIVHNKALTKELKNRVISNKAGIVLACTMIPVAEYTLSFAKNLFTLKVFNKSNFNNINNLDKTNNEKEDIKQQNTVRKNGIDALKKAGIISAAGVLAGGTLALFGHKSNILQKLSKAVIEPGTAILKGLQKAGFETKKLEKPLKSLSLDFANNNGKLALGKGQLAFTAILGLFGYSNAAKDRGKLDFYEVWTRVPLVVFYTIFGSELFEKGFVKLLEQKKKFPDLIKKTADGIADIPKRVDLPKIAEQISKAKNTSAAKELTRLTKEKAIITAVPYAFSLLFMGFSLSLISRLWTQYRYNHLEKPNGNDNKNVNFGKNAQELPDVFKKFKLN